MTLAGVPVSPLHLAAHQSAERQILGDCVLGDWAIRGGAALMGRILRRCAVKLLREPVVHFLLIGAVIFGLYEARNNKTAREPQNRIIVTAGDVERLRTAWSKRWQRPPTAEELKGIVDEHVREEILYREALALGLDRDDTIIRRRLAQKFEFLTEDLAGSRDPKTAELVAYFEAHRERYRVLPQISFTQVYFSVDQRGATVERDAGVALASLQAGSAEATAVGLGDGFMLDDTWRQKTAQDIEAVFGRDFAEAVFGLAPGVWSGPVASGYGLHLVRLDERIARRMPVLSEVEEQVRKDWSYDQRRQVNEAIFERLLARYPVVVEGAGPGAIPLAAPGTVGRVEP
jgi:peptidyl-prolyl cis-trans isomerase C